MVATLIIAILVSLLMPAIMKAKMKGLQTYCASNLRGVGLGLINYAESHDGNFPQQIPLRNGGMLPFLTNSIAPGGMIANDVRPFLLASNALGNSKILLCPMDRDKKPLLNFSQVKSNTVSFFTSVKPRRSSHETLISGDNHINFQQSAASPIGYRPVWSTNRHDVYGNLVFADGHGESVSSTNLSKVIYRAAAVTQ